MRCSIRQVYFRRQTELKNAQTGEVVCTPAKEYISEYAALGFDAKSKSCFSKGEISNEPHLIQISTLEKVFLFPAEVTEAANLLLLILENSQIKKVGLGWFGLVLLIF